MTERTTERVRARVGDCTNWLWVVCVDDWALEREGESESVVVTVFESVSVGVTVVVRVCELLIHRW